MWHVFEGFCKQRANLIVFLLFFFLIFHRLYIPRRDYEDRLCHAALQANKIQRNLGLVLNTMAILKL